MQKTDLGHYSPIILHSYKTIMDDNTAFILMGGHQNYVELARSLNLKNFHIIPLLESEEKVEQFLKSLDIYAHGSPQGDQMLSTLMSVLKIGMPIISHFGSEQNQELVNMVGPAGVVHGHPQSYCFEFWNLKTHELYRNWRKEKARQHHAMIADATKVEKRVSNDSWIEEWLEEK